MLWTKCTSLCLLLLLLLIVSGCSFVYDRTKPVDMYKRTGNLFYKKKKPLPFRRKLSIQKPPKAPKQITKEIVLPIKATREKFVPTIVTIVEENTVNSTVKIDVFIPAKYTKIDFVKLFSKHSAGGNIFSELGEEKVKELCFQRLHSLIELGCAKTGLTFFGPFTVVDWLMPFTPGQDVRLVVEYSVLPGVKYLEGEGGCRGGNFTLSNEISLKDRLFDLRKTDIRRAFPTFAVKHMQSAADSNEVRYSLQGYEVLSDGSRGDPLRGARRLGATFQMRPGAAPVCGVDLRSLFLYQRAGHRATVNLTTSVVEVTLLSVSVPQLSEWDFRLIGRVTGKYSVFQYEQQMAALLTPLITQYLASQRNDVIAAHLLKTTEIVGKIPDQFREAVAQRRAREQQWALYSGGEQNKVSQEIRDALDEKYLKSESEEEQRERLLHVEVVWRDLERRERLAAASQRAADRAAGSRSTQQLLADRSAPPSLLRSYVSDLRERVRREAVFDRVAAYCSFEFIDSHLPQLSEKFSCSAFP